MIKLQLITYISILIIIFAFVIFIENNEDVFLTNKNLLLNSKFNEGLKSWYCNDTNCINLIQSYVNANYVELIGSENKQTQISQSILTISGHVYKLSYRFKADQLKAFAIFRDDINNIEQYLFTNPTKKWKYFSKTFVSKKDGNYRVILSCIGEGKFYYSSIRLIDITNYY